MSDPQKPRVQLSGTDGNVFALLARCDRALTRAGMRAEADALKAKVFAARSYDEAVQAMLEVVDAS